MANAGTAEKGYDSDSSALTLSTPHGWSDLLNQDLPPTHFDTVLKAVLSSKTEVETIRGLDKQEFQSVVDVLGQVRTLLIQCLRFFTR